MSAEEEIEAEEGDEEENIHEIEALYSTLYEGIGVPRTHYNLPFLIHLN